MVGWSWGAGADTKAILVTIDVILCFACAIANWADDDVGDPRVSLTEVYSDETASSWAIASVDVYCACRIRSTNRGGTTAT